jgi:hypothetical protein
MSLNEAQGFTDAPYGPVCDKRARLSAKQAQYVKKDPVWDAQRSYICNIAKETHHGIKRPSILPRTPSWGLLPALSGVCLPGDVRPNTSPSPRSRTVASVHAFVCVSMLRWGGGSRLYVWKAVSNAAKRWRLASSWLGGECVHVMCGCDVCMCMLAS